MTEKTINEVVKDFKQAFGLVEFKAVNHETGQEVLSKNWQETKPAKFEIDADDYLALGNLNTRHEPPTKGVLIKLLKLAK